MATLNGCNCSSGLSNTGLPNCDSVQSVTKKLIYVPIFDNSGVRNSIKTTDIIDTAFLTAKLNESDESKRWYPTPNIENVEDTKTDSIFESLNSGSNLFIQEGARTFMGMHIKESTVFLGKLKSGRCVKFGVYLIDIDGNLTGSVSSDGTELYPVMVDNETYNPVFVKATDTTVPKISVSFEFARTEKDENLRTISNGEISADILGANGLLDGNVSATNPTTTGATLTFTTDYGSFGNKIKIRGIELADVSAQNLTTALPVTLTSVTESTDGVYDVVYPAQTASDVLEFTFTKNGFSFRKLQVVLA